MSSIPQNVVTSKSYKRKEHVKGTQRKTVTFEDQNQKSEEVEQNLGQESLSGESAVEENVQGEEQDLEDKNFSGELRWMSRAHKTDPEEETC